VRIEFRDQRAPMNNVCLSGPPKTRLARRSGNSSTPIRCMCWENSLMFLLKPQRVSTQKAGNDRFGFYDKRHMGSMASPCYNPRTQSTPWLYPPSPRSAPTKSSQRNRN